ncbi:MAG: hypothetical protein M1816_005726 [Peltula sp. TS41687]|nr:MAG: hypothetical protein M1816_005726 [Peltula sp. TS41687]
MRLTELLTATAMITASMAAPIPDQESGRLTKRFNLGGLDLGAISDVVSAVGSGIQATSKNKPKAASSRSPTVADLGSGNYAGSGATYTYGQPAAKTDLFSEVAKTLNQASGKSRLAYDPTDPSTYPYDISSTSRYASNYGTQVGAVGPSTLGKKGATVSGGNAVYNIPPAIAPAPAQANTANNAAAAQGVSAGGAVASVPPSTGADTSGYPSGAAASSAADGTDLSATVDTSSYSRSARLQALRDSTSFSGSSGMTPREMAMYGLQ